jgi:hypothetical protein
MGKAYLTDCEAAPFSTLCANGTISLHPFRLYFDCPCHFVSQPPQDAHGIPSSVRQVREVPQTIASISNSKVILV